MPPHWSSPRVILPVAVLVGLIVRLAPCVAHPDFQFVIDAAYHQRLVQEALVAQRLPAIDRLSNAPDGRRTASELPVGLYTVSALIHRGLHALGIRDLNRNLALSTALWGGLIAIPVWFGTRAAFGNAGAASLAALVAVLLPAHLQRSYGYWFRYDALGTLLVTAHGALALMALSSARPGPRRGLAIASAAILVGAMWTWRVSFIVVAIELAFVVFRLATRGAEHALRDLWVAIAVLGTAGLVSVDYLREQGFVLSAPWLGAIGLALALCLPALGPASRLWVRMAAIGVVAGLAIGVGRAGLSAGNAALPALLQAKLGLGQGHDPITVLMLEVEELDGIAPWRFATAPLEFSVLGAWLLASPALFWWLAGRPRPGAWQAIDPAPALLAFVSAGLTVCTLLFVRTSVLLAPFAAMALGGLGARLMETHTGNRSQTRAPSPTPAAPSLGTRGRGRGASRWLPRIRRSLAALLAVGAAATIVAGVGQAFHTQSRLQPGEELALRFLREHTPREAVVLSFWDQGYNVQTHAGRATVIDGLLESQENRRRILALYAALLARAPDSLERLCARYGARWLLVPPLAYLYTAAAVIGDPIAAKIARGDTLIEGVDTENTFYHLSTADARLPGFRLAWRGYGYRVYEYLPGNASGTGSDSGDPR